MIENKNVKAQGLQQKKCSHCLQAAGSRSSNEKNVTMKKNNAKEQKRQSPGFAAGCSHCSQAPGPRKSNDKNVTMLHVNDRE
jgi:hypothetical protein